MGCFAVERVFQFKNMQERTRKENRTGWLRIV